VSEGRKVLTPYEWECVGIVPDGKKFRLCFLVSQMQICDGDLVAVKLDAATKRAGLTFKQALETGARLDAAFAPVTRRAAPKSGKG
jgi:hypothetical protein